MLGATGAGSYRVLLDDHRLLRTFCGVAVGRLGYAMLPLCLLFTIARSTGSFAVAATGLAGFGACGLAMPVQARLLDRLGQRRVLPVAATGFVVTLVLMVVMGVLAVRQAGAWTAACLGCGLTAPLVGPSMRAQWREAVAEDRRAVAYSLDAVAEETIFLVGPVAAALALALVPAWWGMIATAVLVPVGVTGLVLSPFVPAPSLVPAAHPAAPAVARDAATPGAARRAGPLREGPFRRLLLVMALAGAATGATLTAVAALADRAQQPAAAGLVDAAAGGASVLGGLWWGSRPRSGAWRYQLAALLGARLPLVLGCVLLPRLGPVGLLVALAGLFASPVFVVGFGASDRLTDPRRHTEASTWVTSSHNVGISVGTAATGWVQAGAPAPVATAFALVAAFGAVGVLAALVGTGRAPDRPSA